MTLVHATAVVDPSAELAADVAIGPYAVITADVRIGPGTSIGAHALVTGATTVGARNRIELARIAISAGLAPLDDADAGVRPAAEPS